MNVYIRHLKHLRLGALLLCLLMTTIIVGCQRGTPFKAEDYGPQFRRPGETGFSNFQDQKYIVDGDVIRTDKSTKEMLQYRAPQETASQEEVQQKQISFATSIQKISFTRYDSEGKPTALGGQTFHIQVLSENPNTGLAPIEFRGQFALGGDTLTIRETPSTLDPLYTLTGSITDKTSTYKSKGELYITKYTLQNGQKQIEAKVKVDLRSYLADIQIRTSEDLDPNSNLGKRIKTLEQQSLAWVNNTTVALGRSFYEYQIVHVESSASSIKDAEPVFGFQGESVSDTQTTETPVTQTPPTSDEPTAEQGETEQEQQAKQNAPQEQSEQKDQTQQASPQEKKTPQTTRVIAPFGANKKGLRSFEVELTNPEDPKEKTDVLMTIRERNPEPEFFEDNQGEQIPLPERKPEVPTQELPELLGYSPDAFLKVPYQPEQLPMTAQAMQDLDQNYGIHDIRNLNLTDKETILSRTRRFWKHASPFRKMLQDIYEYFDVPAPLAYVSVFESDFFQGYYTNYLVVNPKGDDTGPFQIIKSTGLMLDMKVDKNQTDGNMPKSWDERLYFFPAACGAAKHMKNSLGYFAHSDATLAILAYNRGDQGAARKLNSGLGWGEADSRLLNIVKKYNFTYAELREQSDKNALHIQYVDRKLAAYFLLQAPGVMNFEPPTDVVEDLPQGVKLIPDSVQSDDCESLAKQYRGEI